MGQAPGMSEQRPTDPDDQPEEQEEQSDPGGDSDVQPDPARH